MDTQRILVIEDDPDIVELLQYNLEREGFEVCIAKTGEEGKAKAIECQPSLILLDLMLPRTSGLDVCRDLRSREDTRRTPLIMVTAKGEESDVVLGLELGADDYVTKPFSVKELIARLPFHGSAAAGGRIRTEPQTHEMAACRASPAELSLSIHSRFIRSSWIAPTLAVRWPQESSSSGAQLPR